MQHLLLTKFQGALIGGQIVYLDRHQIAHNQLIIDTTPALLTGIDYLIECGKFDSQDWSQLVNRDLLNPEQSIVAMLPLMLFFHDDRSKLREVIIDISHSWQLDWETCSCAVTIGYIISRSLTESCQPRTLVAQLLDEMMNLHPLIFQELSILAGEAGLVADRSSHRASSLHQVTQRLAKIEHPIVAPTMLALYCFLSTPEDFSLATLRIARLKQPSPFAAALTGILAGAHNSLSGIPLNGYVATPERAQWLSLAQNLLNIWAGVDLQHDATASDFPLAVAAPQVIQRRG